MKKELEQNENSVISWWKKEKERSKTHYGDHNLNKALRHAIQNNGDPHSLKSEPYSNYNKRFQHEDIEIGFVGIVGTGDENTPDDTVFTVCKTVQTFDSLVVFERMSAISIKLGVALMVGVFSLISTNLIFGNDTFVGQLMFFLAMFIMGASLMKAVFHETMLQTLPFRESPMYLLTESNSCYLSHHYLREIDDNDSLSVFTSLLSKKMALQHSNSSLNLWLNDVRRLKRLDRSFKFENIPLSNSDLGKIVDDELHKAEILKIENSKNDGVEKVVKP